MVKWQARKVVLLASSVSLLFVSMLVYYITYPFLFANSGFSLSSFCLFKLEHHMKELSVLRIMLSGLLLYTIVVVCNMLRKQHYYSRQLQKQLRCIVRKGKQLYILPTEEVVAFTTGFFKPKIVLSEGVFQFFTEEEIDAIVLHEEFHQKNRDPLKLFLFTVLTEGMSYIPVLKGMLQRYSTYQELLADQYVMNKMKSPFGLGSALLKFIRMRKASNEFVTAPFAKTAINLRMQQIVDPSSVIGNIPLRTNTIYVTAGLLLIFTVLIMGECV